LFADLERLRQEREAKDMHERWEQNNVEIDDCRLNFFKLKQKILIFRKSSIRIILGTERKPPTPSKKNGAFRYEIVFRRQLNVMLSSMCWLVQWNDEYVIVQVQRNESLSTYAQYYYNDNRKYYKIYKANRDKINKDFQLIIGTQIKIPLN